MEPKTKKPIRNSFLVKAYRHLWQVEKAIEAIKENASSSLQLSVLGKMTEECVAIDTQTLRTKNDLKGYWKGSLGENTDFGLFCNPEIGTLFIAGRLASQFLHDLDGNVLGAIASGPYGILRGLGTNKSNSKRYIKKLNKGWYLLLVRGQSYNLDVLEEILEQ